MPDNRRRRWLLAVLLLAVPILAVPAAGRSRPPAGSRLLTHGPEPRTPHWLDPPGLTKAALAAAGPTAPDQRAPVCATDNYQRFLLARPLGMVGGGLEQNRPVIQAIARRMNFVLNRDALASGGTTADFKVLCDAKGEVQVDEFLSLGVDFESVVLSARQAGYTDPNVDYSIFVQVPFVFCGQGHFATDESPGEGNQNNRGGDYAVTWDGCWLGRTPMHENGHNQGAVQNGAPHSDGGGHCNEQDRDVMCYPYAPPQGLAACPDELTYDCGYDSYFDARPEPGEWLADHWNIGSPANRFIKFGSRRR